MAPTSKKRKASALEDDAKPVKEETLEDGVNPAKNGHKSPSAERNMPIEESQDMDYDVAVPPFEIQAPARPHKRKSKAVDDVHEAIEDGGFPHLAIKYTIRPGSVWTAMKPYRNFIVGEQKFSLNSIVYINRHSPAPPPPPPNASEAAILAYDRENLWVAKVLEVRASDNQHVYLRVFWLYWPDELPMKRQPYHGANEFIMSNAMDLVDAMTVAGPAEVKQWDEQNDEQDDLGQRFFRQFLDINKLGAKGEALSEIRKHCMCHQYYNPDKTMYKCPHDGCGTWCHEECLINAILEKTYKKLVEDSGPAANGTETEGSVLSNVKATITKTLFPQEKLKDPRKSQGSSSSPSKSEPATPKSTSKAKKKAGNKGVWKGMFSAKITNGDETVCRDVKATITDERGQDPETWTEDVECLKCGKLLD